MKGNIDIDGGQERYEKRLANKNKNATSPFFQCPITPAKDKGTADLRDFKYESLNQNTMKSRRCGGKTSYTRAKENR